MKNKVISILKPNLLSRYILSEFLSVFFLSILAATGLFLVFDTFERVKTFITYKTPLTTALTYLALKIPLILQLMVPICTLVASIISLGRLSQKSELTAMRAGGMSILQIARPLIFCSVALTALVFINGEYIVPNATEKVEQIFLFDIKQKHLSGKLNRNNFWFRENDTFINIGLFDTQKKRIEGITILEFTPSFQLIRRIDAMAATWLEYYKTADTKKFKEDTDSKNKIKAEISGWVLENAVESGGDHNTGNKLFPFTSLPLITSKSPQDLYNLQRSAETFGYNELNNYIKKLKSEGVLTNKYEVDLASKISFPMVCIIATLIAVPFAFTSARSGSLTIGFIAAVSIGFGYYIIHALFSSFGASGILPVQFAAWSANIILLSLGLYLLGGAEFRS